MLGDAVVDFVTAVVADGDAITIPVLKNGECNLLLSITLIAFVAFITNDVFEV